MILGLMTITEGAVEGGTGVTVVAVRVIIV
jgi:hypothetical protein